MAGRGAARPRTLEPKTAAGHQAALPRTQAWDWLSLTFLCSYSACLVYLNMQIGFSKFPRNHLFVSPKENCQTFFQEDRMRTLPFSLLHFQEHRPGSIPCPTNCPRLQSRALSESTVIPCFAHEYGNISQADILLKMQLPDTGSK